MRIFATRLQKGQDLRSSIETYAKNQGIKAGTVISGVGSLSQVRLRMAGAKPDIQDIRDYEGSFEVVSLSGNVSKKRTHLHLVFSDSEGKVTGGHLKEGSIVDTTVELVIVSGDGLEFGEEPDSQTGFDELIIKG